MADYPDIWTIKAALDWCCGYLDRRGDENPRLSSEWLLSEATGLRRVELYVNFDRPLSAEERDTLRGYVVRRAAGEPLQYITGETAFRHIAVKVRPGVLIPRPETEVLVSEALSLLPVRKRRRSVDSELTEDEAEEILAMAAVTRGQGEEEVDASSMSDSLAGDSMRSGESGMHRDEAPLLYVADVCTGSGCIACSIAYERPDARVLATDISPKAFALARENVSALNLEGRVHVLAGNLGDCVPDRFIGGLDLVVSNPPYVPTAVLRDVPREVSDFEPLLALDGGADGLELFHPLTAWAYRALKPGGGYAVELHETCLDAAGKEAEAAGFVDVRIVSDLAGRPRVLTARKPR